MNDKYFKMLRDSLGDSEILLPRSAVTALAREALKRLDAAEATLAQIGATHAGDKLFLSLLLTREQAAVMQQATEARRGSAKFDIEAELTAILAEWLETRKPTTSEVVL